MVDCLKFTLTDSSINNSNIIMQSQADEDPCSVDVVYSLPNPRPFPNADQHAVESSDEEGTLDGDETPNWPASDSEEHTAEQEKEPDELATLHQTFNLNCSLGDRRGSRKISLNTSSSTRVDTDSSKESESARESGSHSPSVEYNVSLKSPLPPEPATPSVADIILLRYHLSPQMIDEKTAESERFDFGKAIRKQEDLTPLKYNLVNLCTIGTGTFGRVQLARHKVTGQYYALNVEHVHHEKQVLQQLEHPFIVKMFDTAMDSSHLYMIMEFLSGGELFSYLRVSKTFSSQVVKFYAAEILLALEYLHGKSIAYRDLKPENLMLTEEGHVKITDFGFAKKIDNKSYTLCGTPAYLAPEIGARIGHNQMVDYWALGILIFELMAGFPPFYGKTVDDILDSIREGQQQQKDLANTMAVWISREKHLVLMPKTCWFKNCDWQLVYDKALRPPLIPTIYHEGDTGNFDSYDELEKPPAATQRQLDLFDEW
uniref:Uncharacterized protein n=1 Tax=Ditylenchus dipsaci TaxID=166011 RepID=A0A915CT99_9BILA